MPNARPTDSIREALSKWAHALLRINGELMLDLDVVPEFAISGPFPEIAGVDETRMRIFGAAVAVTAAQKELRKSSVGLRTPLLAALDLIEVMEKIAGRYRGNSGFPPGVERDTAARLREALRPSGGDKMILAETIVRGWADRHLRERVAEKGASSTVPRAAFEETKARPAHCASQMLWELNYFVDPGFRPDDEALQMKLVHDVDQLLGRYGGLRGGKGRIGARELTVRINDLAGKPLGTYSFSANSIKSAKRRRRKGLNVGRAP